MHQARPPCQALTRHTRRRTVLRLGWRLCGLELKMVGQKERAEHEWRERGELPWRRRLIEDEPREDKRDEGRDARERGRFRYGDPVYRLDPEQFREAEEYDAVDQNERERLEQGARGSVRAEKERKEGDRGQ